MSSAECCELFCGSIACCSYAQYRLFVCTGEQRPLYAEQPVNMLPACKLQVAEATSLLKQWPKLAVEKALELLD
jgi:hypothetical protein